MDVQPRQMKDLTRMRQTFPSPPGSSKTSLMLVTMVFVGPCFCLCFLFTGKNIKVPSPSNWRLPSWGLLPPFLYGLNVTWKRGGTKQQQRMHSGKTTAVGAALFVHNGNAWVRRIQKRQQFSPRGYFRAPSGRGRHTEYFARGGSSSSRLFQDCSTSVLCSSPLIFAFPATTAPSYDLGEQCFLFSVM